MRKPQSRIARWYEAVAGFKVDSLFGRRRAPGPKRSIVVNQPLPPDYLDPKGRVKPEHKHLSNQVITSKYTLLTFLPRDLLEQFRRVANVFFLAIAVLQFFPKFSTISPGLVIFPLLVVLTFTACKDAYEDTKRHQSDRKVNHSIVRVLDIPNNNAMKGKHRTFVRGVQTLVRRKPKSKEDVEGADRDDGWKETLWEDVRVGDIVRILDNEQLPADILICSSSEDDNVAFVETKNLDGETNLKSRHAASALTHLNDPAAIAQAPPIRVDCDRPDTNMYRLNGAVFVGADANTSAPFDLSMTLLRGTVLRNTRWVIGIVLFTGEDTKIVMNSGGTPSKRSRVERQMNPQVATNLLMLAVMAVACAISDSQLEKEDYPRGAPWLYGDNTSQDNPSFNGLVTWAFALITFQNIVPISLYISIEAVRMAQALFIFFDSEIYYAKSDQPTLARSWNLADDLGQIEYIFSDKTGTLTQNSMVFRECSIGGKRYIGDEPTEADGIKEEPDAPPANATTRPSTGGSSTAAGSTTPPRSSSPGDTGKNATKPRFVSTALASDIAASSSPASDPDRAHARALNGFFTVLGLCHTVLADINPDSGSEAVSYKAQSPDEAALVQAAADAGYAFRGKEQRDGVVVLVLRTPFGGEERYELLNVLEFTSARKRMSVVVRKLDGEDGEGRLLLLSKGADNVIFERLRKGVAEDLRAQTETHLDEFAAGGLRTLTLAYKVLQDAEYDAWNKRYHDATVTLDEQIIEDVSDEIEHDLRLLGATAIEDKLQDGVPETIADLKRAGIKVWVATGDKLETAIAIGHSTNLIAKESNIIVIRDGDEGTKPVLDQLVGAVEEFFPEEGKEILDAVLLDGAGAGPSGGSRPGHHRRVSSSSARSRRRSLGDRPHTLRRVNTGVSSIVGADNGDRPGGFILVIDGTALGHALNEEQTKETLLGLAMLCEGVICCRVSPLQKALVVRLVKDGIGAMTLAIGDGANDVSMIQAADVGVGISGEEGLQAVNSSDYAIAQFRFLKRLLLVHGHWSYARNGNMILNFFYKNIVCIGVLWWFQIYNGWSSSYVFEYTYLLWWNAFWTLAPVIAIGVFDRLIDADALMIFPELYRYGREGRWYGFRLFTQFMFDGIFQSAIIFFFIRFTYDTTTARTDGYNVYQYEFATTMVMTAILCANLFNGLTTNFWTGWVFFAISLGIVLSWGYTAIYSIISPGWISTPVFGNAHYLFRSGYFWLCILLCVPLALLPRYLARAWALGFNPNDIDILRAARKVDPGCDLKEASAEAGRRRVGLGVVAETGTGAEEAGALKRTTTRSTVASATTRPRPGTGSDWRTGSRTDMATGLRSLHRGFDFSMEEGGVAMRRIQTGLSEARASRVSLPRVSEGEGEREGKRKGSRIFTIRRKKGPDA